MFLNPESVRAVATQLDSAAQTLPGARAKLDGHDAGDWGYLGGAPHDTVMFFQNVAKTAEAADDEFAQKLRSCVDTYEHTDHQIAGTFPKLPKG